MEQGELQAKLETARNMLSRNMELPLILEITGLSEGQLRDHGMI